MYERVIVGAVVLCACLFLARKLRKTLRGESCSESCGRSCCSGNCCHMRSENTPPVDKTPPVDTEENENG